LSPFLCRGEQILVILLDTSYLDEFLLLKEWEMSIISLAVVGTIFTLAYYVRNDLFMYSDESLFPAKKETLSATVKKCILHALVITCEHVISLSLILTNIISSVDSILPVSLLAKGF